MLSILKANFKMFKNAIKEIPCVYIVILSTIAISLYFALFFIIFLLFNNRITFEKFENINNYIILLFIYSSILYFPFSIYKDFFVTQSSNCILCLL